MKEEALKESRCFALTSNDLLCLSFIFSAPFVFVQLSIQPRELKPKLFAFAPFASAQV